MLEIDPRSVKNEQEGINAMRGLGLFLALTGLVLHFYFESQNYTAAPNQQDAIAETAHPHETDIPLIIE